MQAPSSSPAWNMPAWAMPAWAVLAWAVLAATGRTAEPPLHQEIDRLIGLRAEGPLAGQSSDGEFLRRIYLDLTGTIPASGEARKFLADTSPGKRARLIDELLAGPDHPRHMQQRLTVMLLDRRPAQTITDRQWEQFVRGEFAANRPWNEFVRELIAADGLDERTLPAIRFFVDGGRADHHQLTRDVARVFLGMDLQCAQCHDHPTIADYHQADYFGLYAYLSQSKLQKSKPANRPVLVETVAAGKTGFQSVFTPDDKRATGPRLPGRPEVDVPVFAKGEEFSGPPADGLPATPKFRPRLLLSQDLTSADNERFVLNSVNRLWFLMMGRGLVHPLDMMHSDNPPSHSELFATMGRRFAGGGFDVRWLLREISLSETYQRSGLLPEAVAAKDVAPQQFRVALPRALSSEQLAFASLQATGNLAAAQAAPIADKSEFTYKDYVNGRLPPPESLPDILTLFAATFGNPAGEPEVEFRPSVKGSLFLLNEKLVMRWLQPRDDNLVARLEALTEPSDLADELYLSVLTRLPDEEERNIVAGHLNENREQRAQAIRQLAWALLSGAEFRLNH